jgi:CRISPR type III-B/RAMP module RAMP protein Cmr1
VKNFEILTLELRNITPTIIGGYKATTFSPSLRIAERFRVSELKGVWRWWFRALAAGALWDAYGSVNENCVKESVRAVLGSTKTSSKFILQTYPKKEESPKPLARDTSLPLRLSLLMRKKDRDKRDIENVRYYEAGDLEYSLKLFKQPGMELKGDELRTGIGSLLTALTFQGVGAITRRGFGAWEIKVCEDCVGERYAGELEDYIRTIDELNRVKSHEAAREIIKKLVRLASNDFSRFMGVSGAERSGATKDIPPFPLVSMDSNIFRFSIRYVRASSSMDLLTKIGVATLKATWKRRLRRPSHSSEIHTWILGLPRGQKIISRDKGVQKHGYMVDYQIPEFGRRPSAIAIHPLKRLSNDGWICLLYGFLSRDWPEVLYHVSLERRRVERLVEIRTLDHIREIFNEAFRKVEECLSQ